MTLALPAVFADTYLSGSAGLGALIGLASLVLTFGDLPDVSWCRDWTEVRPSVIMSSR
jgi:hypothetical protein